VVEPGIQCTCRDAVQIKRSNVKCWGCANGAVRIPVAFLGRQSKWNKISLNVGSCAATIRVADSSHNSGTAIKTEENFMKCWGLCSNYSSCRFQSQSWDSIQNEGRFRYMLGFVQQHGVVEVPSQPPRASGMKQNFMKCWGCAATRGVGDSHQGLGILQQSWDAH
jgi:hypothetical protein